MNDGMMQVQLLVPSLKTDATITATMSKADGLTMEIKSDVKLLETSSIQAVTFKYGMSVWENSAIGPQKWIISSICPNTVSNVKV